MDVFLRILVAIAAVGAGVIATIYVLTDWRRDRVGWFLMAMGGSLAYLLSLVVVGWWWRGLADWLWIPGMLALDLALALQLQLMLRRISKAKEEGQ